MGDTYIILVTAFGNRGETLMGPGSVTMDVDNLTTIDSYIAWGSCAHEFSSKANYVESSILKS